MTRSKPRVKYQGFALEVPLIQEIKDYINNDPRYRSVTDFARVAIREKLDKERYRKNIENSHTSKVLSWENFEALTQKSKLADHTKRKKLVDTYATKGNDVQLQIETKTPSETKIPTVQLDESQLKKLIELVVEKTLDKQRKSGK